MPFTQSIQQQKIKQPVDLFEKAITAGVIPREKLNYPFSALLKGCH